MSPESIPNLIRPTSVGKTFLSPSQQEKALRAIKILRLPQVRERTGLSTSTIYSMMAKGLFPKQVPLGVHSVGWVDEEIDNFNAACVTKRDANWQSLGDAAARVVKRSRR